MPGPELHYIKQKSTPLVRPLTCHPHSGKSVLVWVQHSGAVPLDHHSRAEKETSLVAFEMHACRRGPPATAKGADVRGSLPVAQ
jgi:hypothetical protein